MNYRIKQILSIIILIISCNVVLHAADKPHYFKHYQVQHGLSNNIINCMLQDRSGFMWFGTRDGLNRFDGYSFRVFRDDADTPGSIGSSYVVSLAEDANGILWVGTYNGIFRYDGTDETFEQVPFTNDMRATNLNFGPDGDLWMFLNGRLVKYNTQLDTYQTYSISENGTLTSLCLSPLGTVWITVSTGMLYELIVESGELKGYDMFSNSRNASIRNLTRVYASPTGDKIYVGTSVYGAKIFDVQTHTYKDILQDELWTNELCVQGFLQVADDELWIASENGLYIYTLSSGAYTRIVKRPYDPYSLSTNSLYHFFRDRENGIWIGTYAGGINYYSPMQPFEKYYAYPAEHVMKGDLVHDICTDRYGNLWIGTEDAGVNKLDKKTGRYTNYHPSGGPQSISRSNIHGLVSDGDKLWIGSLNSIEVIDIPSGKVVKQYMLPETCHMVIMKKISSGQLLAGTSKGMYYYNEKTDHFDFMPKISISRRIQSITEDSKGILWLGTAGQGIFCYDPATDECTEFILDGPLSFSDKVVNDIFEDDDYNLWFATFAGVKKYNRKDGGVTHYNIKSGMPSNTTFRILEDEQNGLWISTGNGLVNLIPQTGHIQVYTEDHGLITNQFNYNSSWKDADGRMYFGMVRGMISFIPEQLQLSQDKPKVFLTKMSVFDKVTGTNIPAFPVSFTNQIELPYDQSTFSIDFSSLSYIAPNIAEYAFRMAGFDNNWTYLKNAHTAYYTKLPPGKYTFEVRGANVSGTWNDEPTQLSIVILPPWWKSGTAIAVYTLLFITLCLSILYLFIERNSKRMQNSLRLLEIRKEKELYDSKISFFINIAHEIRTPLTLIKSPLEKVMNETEIPERARAYLLTIEKNANRLLNLVNQLLDFRKTEMEGYRLAFVQTDMVSLIDDIIQRFKDTAEQRGLTFSVQCHIKRLDVYIDKEACTKIISNLLTNALKYASTQIILSLDFDRENSTLILEVSNDGEQIPLNIRQKIFEPFFRGEYSEHKQGTGLGLPLARSLAEMHRGSLELVDTGNAYITFKLCLPINQPDSIHFSEQVEEEQTENATTIQTEYELDPARPTILVVEDNEDLMDFIGQEANEYYNIVTASDGAEALLMLDDYSVQLIVSDIMMPVMDGFTLLKRVKSDIESSHIPVILLTAKNTTQSRLEGLELGADAYIEKPFSMDILLAQIANLLNNRNSMRNYYFNSPVANMKSIASSKADEKFLERLNNIILEHINNIDLNVEMIADQMNISRPTLYRKINALSNLTPNDLIRITRLKKAAELILQGKMKIYEISEAVGFNSQSYFSRSFSKQFGMSPSQFAQQNNVEL